MNTIDTLYEKLKSVIASEDRIVRDAPMADYTTFRAGGRADILLMPADEGELEAALSMLREEQARYFVLGNGSNVLVKDGGYRGVIIHIGKTMAEIHADGERIEAQAGALLSAVASKAADHALTGMEFASGIPGSVGGAVFMNAGAYDGEMKMIVERVRALMQDGTIRDFSGDELEYSYRHSVFMDNGAVILSAVMKLEQGDPAAIREKMRDLNERRSSRQPLDKASAGSTFKRPEGYFAGKLIDDAGCRGLSVGAAQVSPKHAGFVVNNGGATASEILDLIALVRMKVKEDFGVDLQPEVRIIGD